MARIGEWAKGISFAIFGILLFYFYWDNIFLGIINFIGDFSITGVTDATSIAILKTIAWVSFVLLFIATVPLYAFFAIISGAKNDVKTKPIELLKAIGAWTLSTPIALILYIIVATFTSSLSGLDVGTGTATASNFSWLIGLICIGAASGFPFYFVLKGYGQIGGDNE